MLCTIPRPPPCVCVITSRRLLYYWWWWLMTSPHYEWVCCCKCLLWKNFSCMKLVLCFLLFWYVWCCAPGGDELPYTNKKIAYSMILLLLRRPTINGSTKHYTIFFSCYYADIFRNKHRGERKGAIMHQNYYTNIMTPNKLCHDWPQTVCVCCFLFFVCVCVCVLHINLSGPNHSAVADPVRGLLDSREKKQPAQDKNKRHSSIEKNNKTKKQDY